MDGLFLNGDNTDYQPDKQENLESFIPQNVSSDNGVKHESGGDCPPAQKKPKRSRKQSDSSTTNSDNYITDEENEETNPAPKKGESAVNADIDEAIARFFHEANIPPIKAENMFFRSMIYKLRPNYSAPDRYQLEQRLLRFRQTSKK